SMNEGVVESYMHFNKRLGVLVEVNCETDFVAATEAFKHFASELARHIANIGPQYVRREDVPQDVIDKERSIQTNRALEEGKPAASAEEVAVGRAATFSEEVVRVERRDVRDEETAIEQSLPHTVATAGDGIQFARVARCAIGESGA